MTKPVLKNHSLLIKGHRFYFDDAESRAAARQALSPESRPAAFLVNAAAAGTGKTAFVHAVLRYHGIKNPGCSQWPKGDMAKAQVLHDACARGYLWLDNINDRICRDLDLSVFVTARRITRRKPRTHDEMETRENNCLIFLTGNCVRITPDFLRRFQVITMEHNEARFPWRRLKLGNMDFITC